MQKTLKWEFPDARGKNVADLATQEVTLETVGPLQVAAALPRHLKYTSDETEQNKS